MLKLDVLMSTYNDEKYIEESISSILNQSYKNFNFIIIDDSSTDNTLEIIKKYKEIDDRIILMENDKNLGLSHNLNKGVMISKADYIARMDADDISHPDRLLTQIKEMIENQNLDVLGSFANEINESGKFVKLLRVPTNNKNIYKLLWTCPFIHPSVMFKRKSILEVGNYKKEIRRRQDYELWFRCGQNSLKFKNIDKPLIDYRINNKEYYTKNNFKVNISQFLIGVKGSWKNRLGLISYLGITVNFLSQMLPRPLKWRIRKFKEDYLTRVSR